MDSNYKKDLDNAVKMMNATFRTSIKWKPTKEEIGRLESIKTQTVEDVKSHFNGASFEVTKYNCEATRLITIFNDYFNRQMDFN